MDNDPQGGDRTPTTTPDEEMSASATSLYAVELGPGKTLRLDAVAYERIGWFLVDDDGTHRVSVTDALSEAGGDLSVVRASRDALADAWAEFHAAVLAEALDPGSLREQYSTIAAFEAEVKR